MDTGGVCSECGGAWRWCDLAPPRPPSRLEARAFFAACALCVSGIAALWVAFLRMPMTGGFNFLAGVLPLGSVFVCVVVSGSIVLWRAGRTIRHPRLLRWLLVGCVAAMGVFWWAYAAAALFIRDF